jgi:hypothetical protein
MSITMPIAMPVIRKALVAFTMAALTACAWLAPLDVPAMQQVDAGLKRALVSFATARLLNAVISVAQGTEASVQPFGVGVTFAPGQILDPVNDLVEQFSHLMLAASVAFGIQKALISIGSYWPVSLALSAAALGWWWCTMRGAQVPSWLSRLLVILLMLRFAVPVVTLGSDLLWQKFLAADYTASQQLIDNTAGQTDKLNPAVAAAPDNRGMVDTLKDWLAKNGDVSKHFDNLKRAAEQATEHIIRLIVIFVLQTLVIPLLLLWALYAFVRQVFERPWHRHAAAPD